jgi:hypothetical protein
MKWKNYIQQKSSIAHQFQSGKTANNIFRKQQKNCCEFTNFMHIITVFMQINFVNLWKLNWKRNKKLIEKYLEFKLELNAKKFVWNIWLFFCGFRENINLNFKFNVSWKYSSSKLPNQTIKLKKLHYFQSCKLHSKSHIKTKQISKIRINQQTKASIQKDPKISTHLSIKKRKFLPLNKFEFLKGIQSFRNHV